MNGKRSRVPSSRLGRLARLGLTAGEMAVGGVSEGVRRLNRPRGEDESSVFLTPDNARRLAKRLAGMRGAAMKMGQLLSMDAGEFMPPELNELLKVLRDNAYTLPEDQLILALET